MLVYFVICIIGFCDLYVILQSHFEKTKQHFAKFITIYKHVFINMFKVKYFNSHFKFIFLYLSAKYSSLSYREHAVIYESHACFKQRKITWVTLIRLLIINLKFKNNVSFRTHLLYSTINIS